VTPRAVLHSVREEKEPREGGRNGDRSGAWSGFSWSSLYQDREGTDSSLSWADDEYEKETTETVRGLFEEVEQLFYSEPQAGHPQSSVQERECHLWREHFPHLRLLGRGIPLIPPTTTTTTTANTTATSTIGNNNSSALSVTRLRPSDPNDRLRHSGGSRQRPSAPRRGRHPPPVDVSQDGCEETFAEHGSYKADCKGDVADETWSRMLSHKFETEPEKYLEEKLLNALMEQLLVGVAEEMQPAVQEHSERLATEVHAGKGWEEQLCGMKSMALRASGRPGRRDSIEEDSIFSLGKIVMSPRYSQYPDLSDDDSPSANLAQPLQPLSLPHLRPGPASAPPARLTARPATSHNQLHPRPGRSNSFKTEKSLLAEAQEQQRRVSELKKQNRSLERGSKPGSSSSVAGRGLRKSRSQSGSPPYGRQPVALPPIERPKTQGSGKERRRSRTPAKPSFSVSGRGLKKPEEGNGGRNGVSSRISMNGPVHWDFRTGTPATPRTPRPAFNRF